MKEEGNSKENPMVENTLLEHIHEVHFGGGATVLIEVDGPIKFVSNGFDANDPDFGPFTQHFGYAFNQYFYTQWNNGDQIPKKTEGFSYDINTGHLGGTYWQPGLEDFAFAQPLLINAPHHAPPSGNGLGVQLDRRVIAIPTQADIYWGFNGMMSPHPPGCCAGRTTDGADCSNFSGHPWATIFNFIGGPPLPRTQEFEYGFWDEYIDGNTPIRNAHTPYDVPSTCCGFPDCNHNWTAIFMARQFAQLQTFSRTQVLVNMSGGKLKVNRVDVSQIGFQYPSPFTYPFTEPDASYFQGARIRSYTGGKWYFQATVVPGEFSFFNDYAVGTGAYNDGGHLNFDVTVPVNAFGNTEDQVLGHFTAKEWHAGT